MIATQGIPVLAFGPCGLRHFSRTLQPVLKVAKTGLMAAFGILGNAVARQYPAEL